MISPRKEVLDMAPYSPPLENRRNKLRLDFNENSIGPPSAVIELLKSISNDEIAAYPEYSDLNNKIAKYLNISVDSVRATNASDEGIMMISQAYLNIGDEILLATPTFAMFKFYAELVGAKIKEILYSEKDLSFPYKNFANALKNNPKIAVFVNPNNPTGTSIDKNFMLKCIKDFPSTLFIIDEAYFEFLSETMILEINNFDNFIVLRTFSKSFGMAGLRLGIVISNKNTIEILKKVQSPYSISSLSVLAGIKALENFSEVEFYIDEVKKSKDIFYKKISKWNLFSYSSSANFVLIKIGTKALLIEKYLKEKGILVRNRSSDVLLEGCIRFTMGSKKQTEFLLLELENALKENNLI